MAITNKKRTVDPSRTMLLRRRFWMDMKKRFAILEKVVKDFFLSDVLLSKDRTPIAFNLDKEEFKFATDATKVAMFRKWLQKEINTGVLTIKDGIIGKPWTASYIENAYRKGLIRAYTETHKKIKLKDIQFFGGAKEQFLKTAFNTPIIISQLELLATRSLNLLKGITDEMSNKMSLILAEGLAHDYSSDKIATLMTKSISNLSKNRALRIARTEIINAHAEGQLDAFEMLGIGEVEAEVELVTAKDEKVCSECVSLEEKRFKIEDARGIIPVHPNCRCAWQAVVETKTSKFKK